MSSGGLWARLDGSTRELRRTVELSPFFQELFFGATPCGVYPQFVRAAGYLAYLARLRAWYLALEGGVLAAAEHPVVSRLAGLEVWRSRCIEADLVRFVGRDLPPLSEGATAVVERYQERVEDVVKDAPHLLAGHVYVQQQLEILRGPLLRARLQHAFDLDEDGGGVAVFGEPCESRCAQLKACFNGLELSSEQEAELVLEARLVLRIRELLQEELLRERWGMAGAELPQ